MTALQEYVVVTITGKSGECSCEGECKCGPCCSGSIGKISSCTVKVVTSKGDEIVESSCSGGKLDKGSCLVVKVPKAGACKWSPEVADASCICKGDCACCSDCASKKSACTSAAKGTNCKCCEACSSDSAKCQCVGKCSCCSNCSKKSLDDACCTVTVESLADEFVVKCQCKPSQTCSVVLDLSKHDNAGGCKCKNDESGKKKDGKPGCGC
ncbi:hypothetical protein QAD02_015081 [Eretmocerus hayati]|uniref:Uncharacterized protein n=1 Tax=Eretmocerus hayati TaxID=131215 RepID=A0ACC2P9P5_9HYME|nr:hypothetical protein QAD02_015081 [Eretmocerus hayati]